MHLGTSPQPHHKVPAGPYLHLRTTVGGVTEASLRDQGIARGVITVVAIIDMPDGRLAERRTSSCVGSHTRRGPSSRQCRRSMRARTAASSRNSSAERSRSGLGEPTGATPSPSPSSSRSERRPCCPQRLRVRGMAEGCRGPIATKTAWGSSPPVARTHGWHGLGRMERQ